MSLFDEIRECTKCNRTSTPKFYGWGNGIDPWVVFLIDFPRVNNFKDSPFTENENIIIEQLLQLMHCEQSKMGVLSLVKCRGKSEDWEPITTDQYSSCMFYLKRQVEIINRKSQAFIVSFLEGTHTIFEFSYGLSFCGTKSKFVQLKELEYYIHNKSEKEILYKWFYEQFNTGDYNNAGH